MSWFDRLMGSSGVDQNDDYIRQIDGAAAAEAAAQAEAAADDNAWKYLSVGDLLGLSDYTNRNYNYRMIPFLGQIVGHASDAATQGVADVAQFLGAQGISDYLNEKAQKGEAELPAMSKPEASLAYLTDPNGLASAFGMMGGSFLSMAPMAAIAPELLPARAAAVLSRVPKALSAVPKIGGALEEMAPMAGRFALTGPIEAMMEGGNTEREMLRNGATPEEARQAAWDVFNENVGLLTATNALEGGLLGKLKIKTPKFSNPVVNTASRAAGYIPTTAAEMALQGYEEGAQQGIQNGVEGQSPNTANQILNPFAWTDAQLDAAKMGIAGAAPLMGAMGVARHFGNRQAQDAQTQAVNDAIRAQQAEADAEFVPVGFGDTDVSAPEIAAPKGQARKAGTDVLAAAQDYMGQRMDNGENGCVEAVTKIGANYNAFLADELGRGVVNVDTLVKDAGDSVVPFDASNVQAGDVIVYGDNDHVVIADGNGGYVGNSSSKQVVVQGDDYNEMGGLKPTKIIKTGSDTASSTGSGQGSADLSGLAGGGIASAIAQRTGLPANLIWAQLAHESDGFSSQLAREDHNYGGITNSDGSYRHFDSDEDFVDFMANYYPKYKENGLYNAKNADEWASALKDGGYFTADLSEYEGGMKRHLADAGLPDGAMPGDNMKGEAASVGIPDLDTLLGNAEAGDDFTKGFYQGAADYILNTAVDEDAISAVSQMTNRNGDFKNTKENRLALATKFADELAEYYDTLSANLTQNAPQAAGQPASAPQVQSAARSVETPHIEKAETPAIDKAKAQQNMRTNTSFRMEDAPQEAASQAGQADAQEMQIASSLAPKMQQAIFRTARNIAVGMQARGQENTQDFMRLRDAIQRRDYGAMMQMYPQEMQSAVAPIVQRGMEELSAKPQEPVQTGKPAAQIAQGRNLIQLAQQNHVSLPSGMVRYLNAGHQKAIDAAEERLQQAGVPLTEMKGVEENETNQRTENQAAPRSEATGYPYQNAESGKGRADAEESEVAPSPHFDTSDFQHTKTGEMIPAAKATERTSKEDFASLKSIAKQNGGYYNRFAKRFLFKDGAGRDAFAQAAEREVFGRAQPLVADHVETAVPVAAAAQEQRATQTSLQEQTDGKREAAEPEGKQLAEIIQKHPEQADAYRVALAGAPDYHGFLDDLRPGAIRQIRSVLEAVGSPFGAGKGSMPVKRLMESLARSPYTKESIKETSSGAAQYMLNGNRVPKAAYRYYQHLKSIGYSGGQDGKEKAGEPKTLAPGYRTESGKPLSEAGEKEFILKPNGSKDFGEITGAISRAAKEQSGVDLAPGKIRLRVGNDKEGLLHAKKHEEQAKADGYASIEDMVADVAENFDSIYAHGLTGDGHTTYSLIKHGNKATGKMNGVAPVYLHLEDDGHGNYYVIVTAIPKGDANLARQTKKDRLIYSSPGLGAATESNAGAVSTSAKNVGAETRGGTPASDKSSGSSTPSVAQEQESGKKNIAYTDGSFSDKSKDGTAMRGTVKNGVMTIWRKGTKKKDTPITTVSVDEVNQALKKGSANSEYTLYQLAKQKDYAAIDAWINGTKDPEIRQKRRDLWENDVLTGKNSAAEDRAVDSAVSVIKELYETATGEPPRSPWEKRQRAKSAAIEVQAQEVAVKGTVDKAAMKPGSADWIAAHPFRYDKEKSVEENSAEATRIAQAYRKNFGETCEINTPERISLRRRIIEELYGNGAEKKEHKAFIVIGLPASGKSSAVAEPLAKKYGALIIDSNEAKERLPEFTDGLLADAVHEESSEIADKVRSTAIKNGDNIVLPLVGKTESKLRNLVSMLKNNGYEVNLHYVDLPVDKAVERGKARFAETGRNVPLAYIRSVGLKPKHNFDKLKVAKEVDSYGEWSNDVDRGQRPRLLEERPAGLYSESELAGRGQRILHEDGTGKEGHGENRQTQSRGEVSSAVKITHQENRSENQDGFSMRENQTSPTGKSVGGPTGKETTVMTDSGKEIRVRYRLVPSHEVITSHDAESMAVNYAYPQEFQPRNRQRLAMREQVTKMANELRPADLGAGRNLNQGAPVIRKDGVVLNGNGRAMAIQKARATRNKSASEYKKYLVQHAGEFGFTPETVMKLDKPMLVREVVGDINADMLRDIVGSTTGGFRMGAGEQAKIDAQKIKSSDLDRYVENDTGDITTAANRDFVAGVLYHIAGENERNAYTDKDGNVNADGIQRVKRALFSLAYEDDELVSKMAESTDDNIRNISNALMNAAPAIAKVNLEMGKGKIYQYDVAGTISEAVKRFSALRDEGKPVSTYLDEQSLFNNYQDTNEMRDVLRFFDENKRSAKRISAFLNQIAEEIKKQGDAKQTSLIATEPQSLKQIIKYAADTATGKEESLFANSESVAQDEGDKKNTAKGDSIFGSVEDADREMLDALGLSEDDLQDDVLEAPPGISNTAEERERLEKELAAELNKISANPVFNPKIYTLGLKLAMTYVKDGYNTFKKLVTKLHTAFGDKIGPWAPALAETVRTWPKGVPFDEKKVMAISKAVGARYEGGITSLDEMQADMKKLLKGQHKSFAPMIEASYNGIRKFFDEKEAQEHGDEGKQEKGESSDAGREGRQSAAAEGTGAGRPEPGGVSGAEGGNREVTRGGNPGRSERENPERAESSGVRAGAELETTAGAGDRERGSEKSVLTEGQAHPSPEETPGHDYEIKPSKTKKTPAVRFRQNIDALKLLKQLEADDRMPTPKEQAVLGNYNGWGGLKEAFLDTKMNKELRAVLTPEEYKAAQSTVNDAFYTPANIVRAVWKGVSRLGFTGGRVLDPSMGVGNFFGCMPRDMMKSSSLRGIEIDDLTSRLARMLYPSALVEHTGFEKAQLADNFYDLVISNIPFDGNHSIAGYKIHNYFFAHGMDKVRPGGLMVYITSQGSLTNSQDGARMRDYIGKKADMVAAYKLPSGAFGEAGTSVGTDIVIFRKRGEHEMKPDYAQDFQHIGRMFSNKDYYGREIDGVPVNEYFKAHPENIIGEASKGRDQYGNDVLLVKPKEGADVAKELSKAMNKLPKDVYEPVNRTGEDSFDSIKANIKLRANYKRNHDLEYWEKDGKIYQNRYRDNAGIMAEEVPAGKKLTRLKGYLKIRSALNSLMLAEMDPEAKETTVSHLRKQLNTVYDAYVKKNGYLNDPQGQRAYIDDPSSGMVMALEKVTYTGFGAKKKIEKAEKTAIFKERTISPIKEVTSVDSPNDALLVSLRNKGRVDLPYMAKLMGSTPETVAAGLDGQIFKNPATERYETRDEYLSGNVREKLAQAENAATQDPSYQKNADALRKVVPEDLIPDEICITMGAPWIPASDVQAFADHITGRAGSLSVKFIPSNAKWVVDGYGHSGKYEAKGIDLSDLLSDILNNKAIEIYSGRGENRTLDREATDAANVIARDMKEDFRTWLWSDKARAKRLARYYNDNYNNTVLREYDGSHLTFPGHNEKIELKPHQKNVVWRMLQGGNTLIAHCVGAGKTFEMQAAGMEMRRLGIANKPLYILPNNVVEQFTKEFYELYPNARLLVLQNDSKTRPGYIPAVPKSTIEQKVKREDGRTETVTIPLGKLSAADRKKVTEARALRTRTLAQIKTEDWDGIIMSHSQFERLPLSPETAASFIEEQLDEVEQAITEAKEGKVDKRTLGTIENQKKKLEENLDAVMKTDPRDIGVPFEQLGIDQIFVDEADMFKNLHYTTSMDRVNGLPNSNANRSMDMYAKTRWLTNANGGRGVVFATGTPVSNTMAEMFTMMRYLDFQGLKEKGLHLFDNWLRTFGEIGSGIERNPSGSGFRKVNKVLRFINMPELTKMFRKFADVKTQDDLDLDIPKLKNGKPTIVKIAPDPVLTNYIKKEVPRRIANMAKRREDMRKGADNMLALTGDLRKMSITDSKIDALADEVAKKYEETTDVKGAQLIFCDQGIPKAEKDNAKESDTESDDGTETENASVYGKIIESLEERGVPKEQIVFIQSAKNKAQMEEIFKKVDSGDIRILIGSTQKMGAGTNCQHHLVALHDLDAPWRPRDLEQRHGRILRQGNPNKEVEIFNYVLQDSFDPIMWEKLKNKASIVAQAMSSNMQQRTVEDADLVTLTYADAENAGTSDPLVKERIALDSEIKKYKHAQVAFHRKMSEAEHTVETAPKKIEELKDAVAKIKDDMGVRQDTRGDKFRMTISGREYTERKEAQAALGDTLAELTSKSSMKIGEISGFDIKAYAGNDGQPHIQLVRKRAYMANTATVAGIENALRKAPETLLGDREEELREKEESLKTAKEVIGQTNPYAEKLAGMEKRFKEINRQIEDNMLGKADDSKEESETPDEAYSVEEQAATKERAIDGLKQEVRDALPGAHSIEDEGDTVSFTMPNGARVQVLLSPSIELNDAAAAKARAAHGVKPEARLRINGRERTVGRTALIELSQLGRAGSAYHETFHAVYDMCLTDKERAALHKAYDKEAKATGRDVLEVMADKYRDWKLAKQKGQHVPFGKLWQKIKDAAGRLLRVIRGVDHASDVFRRVESGEAWERPARTGNQKKYSVEGVENPGEADYNEDRLSDSQKEMLFDSVKRVFDSQVKVLKQHGITEDEINAELTAHNSEQRTKALAGLKATYNQLHAKGLNQEGKREIVERISGNKNLSNAQISALFTKLKTYSEEAVDYAGVIYRELAVHRRGDYGNASQVLTWRDIDRFRGIAERKENNINESRSDIQDGFSSAQNPMHYSAEAEEAPKSFAKKAFLKLAKKSHIKGEKIIVEEQGEEKPTIGLRNYVLSSPSRIAEKVQAFRLFYRMADRAMNVLTKHRSDYARKLGEAMDFVKKKSDRQALYEILLNGDAEGKEYTRQELADDGISENVIEAYTRIRRLMTKAYRMVDDAHRRPKVVSKRMTGKKIAELRENHFVEIMRVGTEEDDGRRLVTYKEYANHEKVYKGIDDDTFRRFREDDSIQILADRGNDDGTFDVKVREGISHMNRLGGYIPHFFHDYMIRVKDSDGGYVMTLGSGRTEREAVKKAEAYLKEHALPEGQKIYISPKVMDFTTLGMSEQQYGAIMGDKDYFKMLASIAKNNDLAYEDAKALIEGSARMKNRHRFFGNAMHRTGVKGYETDLGWVLRHYFNSASRYAALETEFKPQAISLYERLYGDFNRDAPSKEADYTKDYINDINGNPSTLETAINEALMKSKWFRQFIVPRFGDRAALTLGSKLSNAVSYMCLGYFNTSSAFLNLTQVMNSAAYIGDVSALAKCIAKGAHRKYSMHDLKILVETNVLNDIGLDSGSGYDMNRMSAKNLLGKLNRGGMWMFKTSEGIVRRGTVLAAYEAGRKRGMTHEEAIAFAKDVNRKSNFDYGVSDAPNIFRRGSIVSQLALQFKKYGIKELEVMADMFPTNSKTSRKQKAIFWGTYFLTAGLMGLPMLDFFDKWPFDGKLKLSVEECLMEAAGGDPLGKKLATAALFGVAAAVPGIDLSNRAGLSDVIPTRGSDLMGATLSKTANLISDSLKGNGMSAIRDVSPGIYNIVAAARGYSEGKRGRVNDRYNTFYDRVLRAMGFKSTDERVNSDIDRIVNMRKSKEAQEKQDAIDAYLENPSTENAGRLKALGVKPKAVADERKKKQQSRRERTQSGMSKPKQQENERLMQFGD